MLTEACVKIKQPKFRMSRLLAYRHNLIRFLAPSRSFFGSTEKVDIEITNRAGKVHQIKVKIDTFDHWL